VLKDPAMMAALAAAKPVEAEGEAGDDNTAA
jgi:hypothetical protein